jgi:hypothetical protein
MDFTIDFSSPLGPVKPVNGVCNGPSKMTAKYFKKANIPFSRLHDMRTHFHACCDIPSIFRDFDADENDPASYDFTLSDYYIEKIKECGTDIIYRLGSSMEQGDFRFHNEPPKDYAKWARICEHVIRHYNEGWANGHRYDIKYFEIWNEPDGCNPNRAMDGQWTGTPAAFGEFLSVAASHLKKCFPDRYIGSYPSCNILTPEREAFFRTVFSILRKNETPIDFCPWHCYVDDPERTKRYIAKLRGLLNEYGYGDAFLVCTEWNYFWIRAGLWAEFELEGGEYLFEEMFKTASSEVGAAYSLAQMMTFQQSEVRAATMHRADALSMYCTMFNIYGVPQKQFDAFYAYDALRHGQTEVAVTENGAHPGVYAMASACGDYACVAISQYRGAWKSYTLELKGLEKDARYKAEYYLTDDRHHFELVSEQENVGGALSCGRYLKENSILVIKIRKND